MKYETPVLRLLSTGYYGQGARCVWPWICGGFVYHYFGIQPPNVSLTISDRESKDSVPIEVWREGASVIYWASVEEQLRWAPVDSPTQAAWYADGQFTPAASWFVQKRLNPTRQRRRWHVSVWVYG